MKLSTSIFLLHHLFSTHLLTTTTATPTPPSSQPSSNTSTALLPRLPLLTPDDPRNLDLPRYRFIQCTPAQTNLLRDATSQVHNFASAGLTATQCAGVPRRFDAFNYFFSRDDATQSTLVEFLLINVFRRAAPASAGGNSLVTPIRCAGAEDVRCGKPTTGLAYAALYDASAGGQVEVPDELKFFTDDQYVSMITLCPAVWGERVKPLPSKCQDGIDQAAMPDTLVSVIFRELVHLASGFGVVDATSGASSDDAGGAVADTVEQCLKLRKSQNVLKSPLDNASSYMYMAYLAWRASWGPPTVTLQNLSDFRTCVAKVFKVNA